MLLAETSIRRPVFATVLSLLILLIGAVSFNRLSLREYPKIDEPTVTVSVKYPGASAEVIESQVTKPLEDSIAGIDAVDVIGLAANAGAAGDAAGNFVMTGKGLVPARPLARGGAGVHGGVVHVERRHQGVELKVKVGVVDALVLDRIALQRLQRLDRQAIGQAVVEQ